MVAPVLPSRWVIAPADAVDDPDVFPFLSGQSFLETKTPVWSTSSSTSVSGVDRPRALWSYPKWQFKVSYEVLRDAADKLELQRLVTFFNAHFGSVRAFFYLDRTDYVATNAPFGTGDGTTLAFQASRTTTIGGLSFAEPVRGFNGMPTVYVNGTATSAFTINSLGMITFSSAPAAGASLTWSGQFFFLCRFQQDQLDLSQVMSGFWAGSGIQFQSVKP